MKRRKFIQKATVLPLVGSTALISQKESCREKQSPDATNQIVELRRYYIKWGGGRKQRLENYLKDALIPALNRQGIKNVGVFSEMSMNDPPQMYVLIAHPSWDHYTSSGASLLNDSSYVAASKDFADGDPNKTIYSRYDTSLLRSFDGLKEMMVPDPNKERIFELRIYEGHNDDAVKRKVSMFNNGEIQIFNKTGLTPVFFGKMLAGPSMPALVYMLTFKDMTERDANWQTFVNHPDWKVMSAKPEYANSVSNIIRKFLLPTDYSQV